MCRWSNLHVQTRANGFVFVLSGRDGQSTQPLVAAVDSPAAPGGHVAMTTANDDTDERSPIAVLDGRVPNADDETPVDFDALYRHLADERRRRVLRYLWREERDCTRFDDLVAHLTTTGNGERRREVATALFHVDLPALEESGVVDVDASKTVVLRSDATLEWLLAWVDDVEGSLDGSRYPSLAEWFDVLSHPWRRHALALLWRHNVMSLPDIADEVAVEEWDAPLAEVAPEDVLEVYLDLYHDHLPKLRDVGVVEYDPESDALTLDRRSVPVPSLLPNDGERTERQ